MFKSRLIEWIKSLLIIALTVSAVWLASMSPLYIGSPLEERVKEWFAPEEETSEPVRRLAAATRPMAAAVVGSEGRYGVQYNSAKVEDVFENFGPLLGEALTTETQPEPIRESRWKSALGDVGIYFDFGNAVPLTTLADWLREETGETALTGSARRIVLASGDGENDVCLFWQDAGDGEFYSCATNLDRKLQLVPSVSGWMPNAAFFAFEDERYRACAAYTLITDAENPAVYTETISLTAANTENVQQVLEGLSYSFASGASYAISGGTRYTDGVNTFQLTDMGELTYHAAEPYFLTSPGEGETEITQYIETARQLVEDTVRKLCGEAELVLSSVEEKDGVVDITFGYSLNGIPVFLSPNGWAAQFQMENGAVKSFTLYFRSYSNSGETASLLPELQAAAALGALKPKENELILAYHDTGAPTVSAGWIAR